MVVVRAHPRLFALAVVVIALAASIPVVSYVVVPQLVRRTVVEDLPFASSPGGAAVETVLRGELVRISAADYGSGVIRVVRTGNDRLVRFEDVDIAGAPDMYVYLSDRNDGKPGVFVDLGKLKATNGSFNYPIPASVDLAAVRSLVIWCRQFSVTVTYATLR